MAELFLVRHGQASFGTDNYDRLSPLGEQQAVWLGEYFAQRGIAFDRVVVGTMQRHRQTAEAIFRGLGRVLPWEEHPGLNEYDFLALYEALGDEHRDLKAMARGDKRDFYKGLKQVLLLWSEDRLSGPLPETWAQFQQRVAEARRYVQNQSGRRVLAVSSGGAIAATTQQVLRAPAETAIALNMQIRNASFCHYVFNAQSFHLLSFNGVPHLDQPERLNFITQG